MHVVAKIAFTTSTKVSATESIKVTPKHAICRVGGFTVSRCNSQTQTQRNAANSNPAAITNRTDPNDLSPRGGAEADGHEPDPANPQGSLDSWTKNEFLLPDFGLKRAQ
jgi:hypothetical protein